MTLSDIRNIVKQQFSEGDTVYLKLKKGKKEDNNKAKGKILRFYPQFVVVVTDKGIKNYSYIDFIKKAKKV